MSLYFRSLLLFPSLFWLPGLASAQEASGDREFLKKLTAQSPKTVVLLFDVSKSMAFSFPGRSEPVIDIARPFAQDVVNNALARGDRFVLYTFDKSPQKIVDATVGDNRVALREHIPSRVSLSSVKGTNIRYAHLQGLKILEQETARKRSAFLVVLSDGYHDSPNASDPNYNALYIPFRLDKLPDTAQAREYARLARKFRAQNYGVGVQISDNGWVKEKPSGENAAPTPAPLPTLEPLPTPAPGIFERIQANPLPAIWGILVLLALAFGAGIYNLLFKPMRVGLGAPNDTRRSKKIALKHGGRVQIGGPGAGANPLGFALEGTRAPVALIERRGQNFQISAVANGGDARILVNGTPVENTALLQFGDNVKIEVADTTDPSVSRTHILHFNKAEAFR